MVFVYTWWTLNLNKLVGFATLQWETHIGEKVQQHSGEKKCNTYNVIALAVVVVDSRMSMLGLLEEGFHRQRFSVVTGFSLGFLWVFSGCVLGMYSQNVFSECVLWVWSLSVLSVVSECSLGVFSECYPGVFSECVHWVWSLSVLFCSVLLCDGNGDHVVAVGSEYCDTVIKKLVLPGAGACQYIYQLCTQ